MIIDYLINYLKNNESEYLWIKNIDNKIFHINLGLYEILLKEDAILCINHTDNNEALVNTQNDYNSNKNKIKELFEFIKSRKDK